MLPLIYNKEQYFMFVKLQTNQLSRYLLAFIKVTKESLRFKSFSKYTLYAKTLAPLPFSYSVGFYTLRLATTRWTNHQDLHRMKQIYELMHFKSLRNTLLLQKEL